MKIDAELVLKLRTEKSWSQEELGIASGLNIRTIQRIEKESTISLQSKKALASAFGIDIHDLDYKEPDSMKKFEYKIVEIDIKGVFRRKTPDLARLLNEWGGKGWRTTQILPELSGGEWVKVNAILEKEVGEYAA